MQMKSSLIVDLELQEIGVQVGKRLFSYEQLRGFVIEADAKTKTPQNLLLLTEKDHHTYTFADTPEQIQKCVGLLLEHIPYVEEYQQSMLDKFIKKIKI